MEALELEMKDGATRPLVPSAVLRAYIVPELGALITSTSFWASAEAAAQFQPEDRVLLESMFRIYLPPEPEAVAEAARRVPPLMEAKARETRLIPIWLGMGVMVLCSLVYGLVECAALIVFGHSAILRLFGIAIVSRQGRRAGRVRLLSRWILAWLPPMALGILAGGWVVMRLSPGMDHWAWLRGEWTLGAMGIAGVLTLAGLAVSILNPAGGVHDRLAGTRLVPR
jgi:hypothetical protein